MTQEQLSETERLRRAVDDLSDERRALLLKKLADRRAETPAATAFPSRGAGADRFVCSPGQERLYFLHELDPASVTYLLPIQLRLRGEPDAGALRTAVSGLVERHEPLRTGFELDSAHTLTQVIRPAAAVDLIQGAGSAEEVAEHVRRLTRQPFDLADPPLLRAGLWRVDGTDEWIFAMCVHHSAVDGWSLGVLVDELAELYGAAVEARSARLPELTVQYADYAVWQQERLADANTARQLEYWRETLLDAPALELYGDRARPNRPTFDGSSLPLRVDPDVAEALNRIGRAENATPFMVLLAAFTVLLRRWSGQSDLVIGTPVAGRPRPELERLVGFFVNTLALRVDLTDATSFRDLIGRVRAVCLDGYRHQDVPFERVVRQISVGRQGGRPDLPRVLLALRNVPLSAPRLAGLGVSTEELPRIGTDLDLSVELSPDEDGGFSGWLVYATDLFDVDTAQRLADGLLAVLTAVAADVDLPLRSVPVLSAAERHRVLTELSGAGQPPFPASTLGALFEEQADRTPEAVAVQAGSPLTYRELDEHANRLAHGMIRSGVLPEDRIGVHLHRGPDLVVAVLAVLKTGAAYLPLDPGQPAERLDQIVRDAQPRLVLTSAELAGTSAIADRATMIVADGAADCPAERPDVQVSPDGVACVLYTSGSTGRPKGVLLTQRNLANRMRWMCADHGFGPRDVVLQKTPISSDPALWEMFVPLFTGGRLVLAEPGRHTDPDHLLDLLREHRVTACDFVPSMLRTVLAGSRFADSVRDLRLVVCGGEELPAPVAERFLELAPQAALYNFYGPTETGCDVTVHRVTSPVPVSVPIGRPAAGVELYVLDEDGGVQPVGVPGELFVGGVQAARGYLGRPGRTAESLVPHLFRAGQRLYRTGDRVRWRADGTLDFLGRLDSQVKIRGYRVEPGEVETALRAHDAVEEAAVLAWPRANGEHQLVGYLTAPAGVTVPDRDTLRGHLGRLLPTPMIPALFVTLDEFPLLSNGKIDRNRLPEPEWGRPVAVERVPPTGPLHRVLCRIWEQVLETEDIGVHDDFFELGGHSLLATQVVSQVREVFRMDFPLHFFVETPTVAAFATLLRERGVATGVDVDRVADLVLRIQAMSAEEVGSKLRPAVDGSR